MIKIYPFNSFLPKAEAAAKIACEPYDVINTEEARERAAGNEDSYLHVVRPEIDFAVDQDPYAKDVYERSAENLNALVEKGILAQDSKPGIFLYRQIFQGRQQCGVVCCYDVDQYRDDTVKKHEKTRPEKEDDRTRHLTTCSAQTEPVFLCFRDNARLGELMNADTSSDPIIDFEADGGVTHTVWRVANPESYVEAFKTVDNLYIADGHHRTAAAERAATLRQSENPNHSGNEEYNRVLSVMFPESQLKILAYNRVVKDLNGLSAETFLDQLGTIGELEPTDIAEPESAGQICVYVGAQWYRFKFPSDSIDHNDPIHSLDVALLQSRILEAVLGVGDPRTDARIGFVGGIRGTQELEHLVDAGEMGVAFSMFPTSIKQLIDVSDAGKIMPPKSTWFEPKLRSGLFVHFFESY